MSEDRFLIYRHVTPNGKSYIGQTRYVDNPNRRWCNGQGYMTSPIFSHAIKKYGWENITHEILETNLTYEEANEKECYWIDFYDSCNRNKGYNVEYGGGNRKEFSLKTRKKISKALSGRKLSKQTKEKIRQANLGKKRTKESIEKQMKHRYKPVIQYDLQMNFIAEYSMIKEAAQKTGCDASSISKVCKHKAQQSKGFIWRYKNEGSG